MHSDVCAAQPVSGALGPLSTDTDDPWQYRRELRHDIQHQVGTIMLLAGLLDGAVDVGPASRARLGQIVGEVSWLDQLLRAYDGTDPTTEPPATVPPATEPVHPGYRQLTRLDVVAGEIVTALALATTTRVTFVGVPVCAYVERLALRRAVRNLADNAVRAAGPAGTVQVSVRVADGRAVLAVDDDGPGFGAAPPGLSGLGLGIARSMVAPFGGTVQQRASHLGGGCVRLLLPVVPGAEVG